MAEALTLDRIMNENHIVTSTHLPTALALERNHGMYVYVFGIEIKKTECIQKMNILVTGGAGFIGSHVVDLLVAKYPTYNLVILDKMDYCASKTRQVNVTFIQGDIAAVDLVSHILESFKISHVLHFAAQTHVDNSFGNSIAFTMNNTLGTHCLLECCRKYEKITLFINVSTDEVYGDSSALSVLGLDEQSNLAPTNPYAAAKAGAEMICKAYQTSYNMPIIITRGNNVYGPRQYPEKLIPKHIVRGLLGLPLPVHGPGTATRSYLYVSDVADAFDRILHQGTVGETYNIGTDDERCVLDIAKELARAFDVSIEHVKDRVFNDSRYFIGYSKLSNLGWKQTVSWTDGLARTVDWYKNTDLSAHWDNYIVS